MAKHAAPASEFTTAREKRAFYFIREGSGPKDRFPTSWGHVPQFCKSRHCSHAGMENWVPVHKPEWEFVS